MQQFKNVALHPVDVGGRVLASGEIAELSPTAHAVHQAVSSGHLLALTTFQEAPEQPEPTDDGELAVAGEADDEQAEAAKTPAPKQRTQRES